MKPLQNKPGFVGFRGAEKAEIEQLFSHLELIAPALAAAGVLTNHTGMSANVAVSTGGL
jgi:hypothetical protein